MNDYSLSAKCNLAIFNYTYIKMRLRLILLFVNLARNYWLNIVLLNLKLYSKIAYTATLEYSRFAIKTFAESLVSSTR